MVDGWTAGAALDATVLVVELRLAWVVAVARPNPPVEEPPSEKAGGGAVVVVAAVLLAPEYKTISVGQFSSVHIFKEVVRNYKIHSTIVNQSRPQDPWNNL